MKKAFKKSEYFLAATFALVAAFPLAVQQSPVALGASVSAATTIQEKALSNYTNYRDNRRDYQKASELCAQLRKNGKDVTCPNINDAAGIAYFLSTHSNVPVTVAATGTVVLNLGDLTPYQLNLMRWYQKANTCPDSMKNYLPGFFALCQSLLNPHPVVLHGTARFTNSSVSSAPDSTLDDIIKANKGVKRTW